MTSTEAVVANESIWLEANRFYEAESRYFEVSSVEQRKKENHNIVSPSAKSSGMSQSSLASEIAHARQKIQNFLKSGDSRFDSGASKILDRLESLEKTNEELKETIGNITSDMSEMSQLFDRLSAMEAMLMSVVQSAKQKAYAKEGKKNDPREDKTGDIQNGSSHAADNTDQDLDLFGSDEEEDADAAKVREERLKAYANKKAKKQALVAKSSVVLDVKPWDDETDLGAMEKAVRGIETGGLVWGASKLVPLAYGIKKLQIVAIVEDEKVSIDWLQEAICEMEDLVQSVDVAAFNKL